MSFSHPWIEAAAAASVGIATAVAGLAWWQTPVSQPSTATVIVAPGEFDFEPTGEFIARGVEFDPGDRAVMLDRPIEIMKYQVTLGEYLGCVEAKRCELPERSTDTNAPVIGVNFLDARAYADWYSDRTGERWRLPTAEEWAYVAAERFAGEVFGRADDPSNPAIAWIRRYEEQIRLGRKTDPVVHPTGHFGPNSNGVYDLGGNVWEWTSACYTRTEQDPESDVIGKPYENCGIRIAEGLHRAYMTNFIREGKSGGCAVGTPPDHLGFRLVRDGQRFPRLARLGRAIANVLSL